MKGSAKLSSWFLMHLRNLLFILPSDFHEFLDNAFKYVIHTYIYEN